MTKKETLELEPLYGRALIRAIRRKRSDGGLHVPGVASTTLPLARVVAVGDGDVAADGTVMPPRVKPGDVVTFNPGSIVYQLDVNNEILDVINEGDLLCRVRGLDEEKYGEGVSKIEAEQLRKDAAAARAIIAPIGGRMPRS